MLRITSVAALASCSAYVLPNVAPNGAMRAQVQMSGVINDNIDKENPKVKNRSPLSRHCTAANAHFPPPH